MVFAFAGLSTITSFFAIARDTLASHWDTPLRASPPEPHVHGRRAALLAAPLRALPPPRARPGAPSRRRVRPRREPQLELRPVAARAPALPAPPPALHGEVGALLDAVQAVRERGGRISRPARRARHGR